MPTTLLSFDYGTQSIGVAVGQAITQTASELKPLKANDGVPNWNAVGELIQQWQPDLLIIGLPLNMDGSESELAARARKFANRLNGRFHIKTHLMDERLSTYEAKEEAMARRQTLDFKKNPVDSIAARLILESWFHEQSKQ
ncbi:Holliday junction resolvase RuvX [Aurantivibrio plasticivorans]